MKKRPEEAPLNRACIEERLRDDENSSKGKIYEKVLKFDTVVEKVWRRHLYTREARQGKKPRMSGRGNENGWERFYRWYRGAARGARVVVGALATTDPRTRSPFTQAAPVGSRILQGFWPK